MPARPRNLTVRLATEQDADAILGMARELAAAVEDPPPPADAARLRENALGAGRWCDCFIAIRGDAPIAYALACRGFEAHTGQRRLWLGDLYVRPAARRGGVARALMAAVARHALDLGCTAVYWELWRKNAAGEAFYRGLAAETCGDLAVLRLGAERLAELTSETDG
jgi:GNAT superfamily N-acetyltransferase